MAIVKNKIIKYLSNKNLSCYKLSKMLSYHEGALNSMINGKKAFPVPLVEKLLPILEISKEEFISWIIADKYPKEAVQAAIGELKNKSDTNAPALAKNIDKILSIKGLSRTELSKHIQYDQGSVNKMIIGKISMSKTVITKIAPILEVNKNVIQGWILADKYSLSVLEFACKHY